MFWKWRRRPKDESISSQDFVPFHPFVHLIELCRSIKMFRSMVALMSILCARLHIWNFLSNWPSPSIYIIEFLPAAELVVDFSDGHKLSSNGSSGGGNGGGYASKYAGGLHQHHHHRDDDDDDDLMSNDNLSTDDEDSDLDIVGDDPKNYIIWI